KSTAKLFFNMQASGTTKDNQVKQRVTAQTVCTVNRNTGGFTAGKQTRDGLVVAVFVLSQRLTTHVGRNTAHHVMAGWNYRNRLFYRVYVSKRTRQFADARQAQVQGFFTQVIQLQ